MPQTTSPSGAYSLALVFSILFALIGFSYNVWRMEVSEENNNIRTASFELLLELAELEQLIYSAHYDGDSKAGNPRIGWVKVGLISDLSTLTSPDVVQGANTLRGVWTQGWERLPTDRSVADQLVAHIDAVRGEIKSLLRSLE